MQCAKVKRITIGELKMGLFFSRDCIEYDGNLYFMTEGNVFPAVLNYDEKLLCFCQMRKKSNRLTWQ